MCALLTRCTLRFGIQPGQSVLGHFPGYIALARRIGARHFDVGSVAWRALVNGGVDWTANQHFLDSMIHAGDAFVFSINPTAIRRGSLLRELRHLRAKGVPIPASRTIAWVE